MYPCLAPLHIAVASRHLEGCGLHDRFFEALDCQLLALLYNFGKLGQNTSSPGGHVHFMSPNMDLKVVGWCYSWLLLGMVAK